MKTVFSIVAAALLIFVFAGGASARGVDTDLVEPAEIQSGTYTLIAAEEPAPIAILKKEGAGYDIRLGSAGSGYTVTESLSEDRALMMATDLLEKDSAVTDVEIAEIKGPDGNVIGYELTPVFMPLRYGSAGIAGDVTGTSYSVSEEKERVLAYVAPDPLFEAEKWGGG